MSVGLALVFLLLIPLLTLVSYVVRLHAEAGKFLSREFQENIEVFEQKVEPRLGAVPDRAALAMAVLQQFLIAILAFLCAIQALEFGRGDAAQLTANLCTALVIILVFHRLLPFLLFSRTRGEWLQPWTWLLRLLILLMLPFTVVLSFAQSVVALTRESNAGEEPEHPSEAVDALIEAGQDEGILEEGDRELIHSVVEFGDKVVREVMTPRPDIVAVPGDLTVEELTHTLTRHPYSRLPVYDSDIDHIVGIVFARDVLQVSDAEAATRQVRTLMKPEVRFVPETKQASSLLSEMQQENTRLAVVIDEYGSTAGVVTTEDLVEEIVGELRDEREPVAEIVRDSEGVTVNGTVDVGRLEDLFSGLSPLDCEATTVGGLVTEIAGRIPQKGETAEGWSLRFEVLASTPRRVERVRITRAEAPPPSAQNL
jgi:CBS domain containing-hemolysin-like protein